MAGSGAYCRLTRWLDRLLPGWREIPDIHVGCKLIAQVEALLQLAERHGRMDLVHAKADFDWHWELIVAMLKHADVRKIVLAGIM